MALQRPSRGRANAKASTLTCVLPFAATPSAVAVGARQLSQHVAMLRGAANELRDATKRLERAQAMYSRALVVFTTADSLPLAHDERCSRMASALGNAHSSGDRSSEAFERLLHPIEAYHERCLGVEAACVERKGSHGAKIFERIIEAQAARSTVAYAAARALIELDLASATRHADSLQPLLNSLPSQEELEADQQVQLTTGLEWLARSSVGHEGEAEELPDVDDDGSGAADATNAGADDGYVVVNPGALSGHAKVHHSLSETVHINSIVDRARHGLEGLLSAARRPIRKRSAKPKELDRLFGLALDKQNVAVALWFQRICAEYILTHGAALTGVLRVPGERAHVYELKEQFNAFVVTHNAVGATWAASEDATLYPNPLSSLRDSANSVHDVASLLKLWYREMREPLLSGLLYEPLVALELDKKAPDARVACEGDVAKLVATLPVWHRQLLDELIRFLHTLSEGHEEMTHKNVAICIGPTVMRPAGGDDVDQMARMSELNSVRCVCERGLSTRERKKRRRRRRARACSQTVRPALTSATSLPPPPHTYLSWQVIEAFALMLETITPPFPVVVPASSSPTKNKPKPPAPPPLPKSAKRSARMSSASASALGSSSSGSSGTEQSAYLMPPRRGRRHVQMKSKTMGAIPESAPSATVLAAARRSGERRLSSQLLESMAAVAVLPSVERALTAPTPKVERARALYDWDGEVPETDCTLREDDIVVIVRRDDDWCYGWVEEAGDDESAGGGGGGGPAKTPRQFPSSFVERIAAVAPVALV